MSWREGGRERGKKDEEREEREEGEREGKGGGGEGEKGWKGRRIKVYICRTLPWCIYMPEPNH